MSGRKQRFGPNKSYVLLDVKTGEVITQEGSVPLSAVLRDTKRSTLLAVGVKVYTSKAAAEAMLGVIGPQQPHRTLKIRTLN